MIRPFSTAPYKMGGDGHKCRVKSGTKISQGVEVDHTGMVRVFYQNELKIGLNESKWREILIWQYVLLCALNSLNYICKRALHLTRRI